MTACGLVFGKTKNGEIENGKYRNEEISDQTLLCMSAHVNQALKCQQLHCIVVLEWIGLSSGSEDPMLLGH